MDKGFSYYVAMYAVWSKKIPSQLSFTYQWMVSPQFGPQVSPLVRPSPSPVLKTP